MGCNCSPWAQSGYTTCAVLFSSVQFVFNVSNETEDAVAMRLQRQSNQQIITLDVTSTLGHGGEARVFAVPQDETLVAKVYHKPTVAHAQNSSPCANPEKPDGRTSHISIAWRLTCWERLVATPRVAQNSHGWLPDAAIKGCTPSLTLQSNRQSVRSSTIHICTALHVIWLPLWCPACAWILLEM